MRANGKTRKRITERPWILSLVDGRAYTRESKQRLVIESSFGCASGPRKYGVSQVVTLSYVSKPNLDWCGVVERHQPSVTTQINYTLLKEVAPILCDYPGCGLSKIQGKCVRVFFMFQTELGAVKYWLTLLRTVYLWPYSIITIISLNDRFHLILL